MSNIGDKFIFEIAGMGFGCDNSNKLICGDFLTYISENKITTLKKYPTWIPMNEKIPIEEGMYNVTFDDGFVTSAEWNEGDWELWADSGEVVAWMSLPEPYKK